MEARKREAILFEEAVQISDQIIRAMNAKREKEAERRWAPTSNSASELGNPCLRFAVLRRLKPDERKPKPLRVQYLMEMGTDQEDRIVAELNLLGREVGFKIHSQQREFNWAEAQIKGRHDGILEWTSGFILPDFAGKKFPIEIKTLREKWFLEVNSVEDFQKFRWMRKYTAQLDLYLYMNGLEVGMFILLCPGHEPKFLPYLIDYDLADELEKRARKANEWLERKMVPPFEDRGNVSVDDCRFCDFSQSCLPDLTIDPAFTIIDESTTRLMIEDLKQREELLRVVETAETEEVKNARRALKAIEESIEAKVEGSMSASMAVSSILGLGSPRPEMIVGDWILTGQVQERKFKAVPAKEAHSTFYFKTKIERLVPSGAETDK